MEGWVDLGYPSMHRPGVELAIFRSRVRRPNQYTTEAPEAQTSNAKTRYGRCVIWVSCSILSCHLRCMSATLRLSATSRSRFGEYGCCAGQLKQLMLQREQRNSRGKTQNFTASFWKMPNCTENSRTHFQNIAEVSPVLFKCFDNVQQ